MDESLSEFTCTLCQKDVPSCMKSFCPGGRIAREEEISWKEKRRLGEQNARYEQALQEILRTSSDGEAMRIAADALGVPLDTTEPE